MSRTLRALLRAGTCGAALLLNAVPAAAQSTEPRNMLGTPGFLDMPNARMGSDGEFTVGATYARNIQHYNFSFQVLPWLEGSLIYSGLEDFKPDYSVYWDRSFALKARLWDETDFWPAVAVGVNDMIGTGVYSSEYVVASKRFGDLDTSIGIGWGRMATANTVRNPLGLISNSFLENRSVVDWGDANFGTLFRGKDAGIFGGMTWYTPINGLSISAEYSSDIHVVETITATLPKVKWPVNVGVNYRLLDGLHLSLSWLYGNTLGGGISYRTNPFAPGPTQRIGTQPVAFRQRSDEEQRRALQALTGAPQRDMYTAPNTARAVDGLFTLSGEAPQVAIEGRRLMMTLPGSAPAQLCPRAAMMAAELQVDEVLVSNGRDNIRCPVTSAFVPVAAVISNGSGAKPAGPSQPVMIDARPGTKPVTGNASTAAILRRNLAAQSINVQAIAFQPGEIAIYYHNGTYYREQEAVERITRVLTNDAPPEVERFRMVAVAAGVPQRDYVVMRTQLERDLLADPLASVSAEDTPAPMRNPGLAAARALYPRFEWSLGPQFRQQLFDPNNPFAMQLLVSLTGQVEVLPGLTLQGAAEASLIDNFNVDRPSDSLLPHVRTEYVNYFTKGKNGIANLEGSYRFRLTPEVFGIARAGLLESMFAGVGGEILWRPEGARWALGADLYAVQQRGFTRLFDMQNYRVMTGHVSLYYASPWYDLQFALRAGQYLAGDRGLTVEISRRFESGVEIGLFATKTNVSATQFGEGTFDKGFRIRFPLSWMVPINTQSELAMDIRPVQRDGGQRLLGDTLLYEETRRVSQAEKRIGQAD